MPTSYVLILLLRFAGPDPNHHYNEVPVGGSLTSVEFSSMERCRAAAEKAQANFANAVTTMSAFCTEK